MKITFVYHSCFAVETGSCILVFDYWKDPAGVIPSVLSSPKPVYVFSSHFHEDHFNSEIFRWRERRPVSPDGSRPEVIYILSKDILRHRRAEKGNADIWLAKGGRWEDGNVCVTASGVFPFPDG